MTTRPATSPTVSGCGAFALVSYLPDPLGSFLTELRQLMPGDNHANAHITFLPPRVLSLPKEQVANEVSRKVHALRPFEVALGEVMLFPETNLLYLSVKEGHRDMLNLHDTLNDGGLFAQESFEFVPHLTLSGPLDEADRDNIFDRTKRAWESSPISRSFTVSEIVLLWQPEPVKEKDWARLLSYPLTGPFTASSAPASSHL